MNVVLTHTDLRLYWPARLRALQAALQASGHALHVIECAGAGSPYAFETRKRLEGMDWEILLPGVAAENMRPRLVVKQLMQRFDQIQPEVVVAGAFAFPPGAAAIRWALSRGRGCVMFDDVRRRDVARTCVVDMVKRCFYRNLDALLVPAESHEADFLAWGVPAVRIFYGVDVVDNDFFRQSAQCQSAQDQPAAAPSAGSPFFLGVGRHIRRKNWEGLLRACHTYVKQAGEQPWSLVLIGNGPERAHLEAVCHSLGLSGIVQFLDFVDQVALRAWYQRAGALILPSFGEPWGLVVNEAMAAGLPVLVSEECGCAQTLVEPDCNGWRFNPRDTDELVQMMVRMSTQPEAQRKAQGQASRRLIDNWGLDRFVDGMMQAIACASGHRRARSGALSRLPVRWWNGRYRIG